MARGLLDFWNEWGTRILVLFSLSLQVILNLLAKVRRRKASSAIKRAFLWLAYQLSDITATYAAGQLFFSGTPQDDHLIAFWAPFLLLHLGGPDNITAYALEDNKLWKRHFLSLVLQVLGAVYVLYKHIAGSGILLILAAVLISVVGVVKYGERTCALWFANFSSLQRSLKVQARDKRHKYFYIEHEDWYNEDELVLQHAHSLFHICKRGIVDSVIEDSDSLSEVDSDSLSKVDSPDKKIIWDLMEDLERMWRVMEMELSLMYDILYTKAGVIHSWVGYCIRIISPPAVLTSLVLFQLSSKDSYSRVDVAITYTLLVVAFVLETKSLLGAVGSSWTLTFLCSMRCDWLRHSALCTGRWHRLRRTLISLRRSWPWKMIMTGNSRRWSGTMGQHNMLRFRAGQMDPMSRHLGNLCKRLRLGEWWNTWHYYSWTVDVPEKVKKCAQQVKMMILPRDINTMGLLRHHWGELALNNKDYPGLLDELRPWRGVDFHESVIVWHVATDLILAARDQRGHGAADHNVEAVRVLSNYMMFLLVNHPDMLPGLPQNWLYEQTCNNVDKICNKHMTASPGMKLFQPQHHRGSESEPSGVEEELAGIILRVEASSNYKNPRLTYARMIASKVLDREENAVILLLNLWMDFLAFAANRCSREAHARELSSGGELVTVLWLYIEHLCQIKEDTRKGEDHA